MGVRNFHKFVGFNPDYYREDVDVAEYGRIHRERGGYSHKPVLVVDLFGVSKTMLKDLDSLCGGQHGQAFVQFRLFVERFRHQGITLVFVMDGALDAGKAGRWVERQGKAKKRAETAFSKLSDGMSYQEAEKGFFGPRFHLAGYVPLLGCELLVSEGDADFLAAQVARERGAFGILANDSDFLFFPDVIEADVKIFSQDVSHITYDEDGSMRTLMYDPLAICSGLGLDPSDMPYLATLMGNDYSFPYEDLTTTFHASLLNGIPYYIPLIIKKIVKRLKHTRGITGTEARLRNILEGHGDEMMEKLVMGVRSYTEDLKLAVYTVTADSVSTPEEQGWNEVLAEVRTRVGQSGRGGDDFGVMRRKVKRLPYRPTSDDRGRRLPASVHEVTLELRRRIYSILLSEKPGAVDEGGDFVLKVKELSINGFREIRPAKLPIPHPGLLTLYKERGRDVEDAKWDLFRTALDPRGNTETAVLKGVDPLNFFAFCSLFVMAHSDFMALEEWEIQAFLVHHFELRRLNRRSETPNISAPLPADIRCIGLASIFLENPIGDLDWAVGYVAWDRDDDEDATDPEEKYLRHRLMDGFLLQRVYRDFAESGAATTDRKLFWQEKLAAMETDEDRNQAGHMLKNITL